MLFKFRYPKLAVLIISIILSYTIFTNPLSKNIVLNFFEFGYPGVFIAGVLFPFGFTTAFSVGFFVSLNPENIFLNAFVGALGAAISNFLIFSFVRFSFKKEFLLLEKRIERVKLIRNAENKIKKDFSKKLRHYLMYVFVGIIIVSPVPDEIADILLAGLTKIKPLVLGALSFFLSFIGISILLRV